jgi:hypothetical protein
MADDFVFEEKELPPGDHWRAFFDSRCLRHWHLGGKELTFTIASVKLLRSKIRGGTEKKQLALHFKTTELPLVLNVTNATTIAQLYGNKPQDWVGKRLTLFVTTTQGFGTTTDCIRVRPRKPEGKPRGPKPRHELDMGDADETPPEPGPNEPADTSGRQPGDD